MQKRHSNHFNPLLLIGHTGLDYFTLNDILEQEVGDFLRKKGVVSDFISNDLRHQYVSAVYTQIFGPKAANLFGRANETFGLASGRDDMFIDLACNHIGREYGVKYPNADRQTLLRFLYNDYGKNRRYRQRIVDSYMKKENCVQINTKSGPGSRNPGGRWVTINGRHVFIEN